LAKQKKRVKKKATAKSSPRKPAAPKPATAAYPDEVLDFLMEKVIRAELADGLLASLEETGALKRVHGDVVQLANSWKVEVESLEQLLTDSSARCAALKEELREQERACQSALEALEARTAELTQERERWREVVEERETEWERERASWREAVEAREAEIAGYENERAIATKGLVSEARQKRRLVFVLSFLPDLPSLISRHELSLQFGGITLDFVASPYCVPDARLVRMKVEEFEQLPKKERQFIARRCVRLSETYPTSIHSAARNIVEENAS